ncbi:acyltransferase family protein [Frondihabitans cladoniiphilus]|uniref:SGNH hydrolase domain-containing protein n=1 Tax=Frondihabitans cladoniiphilus TaxID=715785 RepID=A0ABP8WAH5_9MICO
MTAVLPRPAAASRGTTTSAPRPSHFRPDIEGLRAFAVFAVVAFHAAVPGLSGGFAGVDVFFVISGYLITGQLSREVLRTGRVQLLSFYARRARRLLPAAGIVLVATAVATAVLEPLLGVFHTAQDLLAAALYTANWHFIALGTDYLAQSTDDSPVLHFWSLAVEEQFYLVWPLLIIGSVWLAKKSPMRGTAIFASLIGAVTAASLVASIALTPSESKWAYMATQTRGWEFGFGGLLAIVAHVLQAGGDRRAGRLVGRMLGWAGLAAIVVACLAYDASTPFPGFAALLPVLGTTAVIAGGLLAGTSPGSVGSLLSLRPIRYVGRVSYAWYLWHWPLLILVEVKTGTLDWQTRCLLMAVAFVLAALTLHLVEIPLSKAWKSIKRIGPTLAIGMLCMVVTVATPLVVGSGAINALGTSTATVSTSLLTAAFGPDTGKNSGPVSPNPLAATNDIPHPTACILDAPVARVAGCEIGPADGEQVVAFGDSHVNQWLPAFQTMATANEWHLTMFAKSGCPVADYAPDGDGSRLSSASCVTWRQAAIDQITAIKPKLIIVSSYNNYISGSSAAGEAKILADWNHSLDQLRTVGSPIAYIQDTPYPNKDIPTCMSSALSDWSKCDFPRGDVKEPVEDQALLGNQKQVSLINLSAYLCNTKMCPAVRNGLLLYRDESHITASAATALEPAMSALFAKAGLLEKK